LLVWLHHKIEKKEKKTNLRSQTYNPKFQEVFEVECVALKLGSIFVKMIYHFESETLGVVNLNLFE
jgi:hypothetical protein